MGLKATFLSKFMFNYLVLVVSGYWARCPDTGQHSCYTKFATTAEGPKMSQAKQLVEAKFSVRECFTSRL